MKYADGSEARIGDRVLIRNGDAGTIVISVSTNEYGPEFPRDKWKSLRSGVLVRTDKGSLVHFEDPISSDLVIKEPTK